MTNEEIRSMLAGMEKGIQYNDANKAIRHLLDENETLKEQMAADINFMRVKGEELAAAQERAERLEGALTRIHDMSERPQCVCGRPTGTAAIKQCASNALNTGGDDGSA